jgi:Rad3-related DNA helicase
MMDGLIEWALGRSRFVCCDQHHRVQPMASESLSFRITRTTEDLAQTTHALSQRLVKLEQRLETLELELVQLREAGISREPEQVQSLETVERLLSDCRCLLGLDFDAEALPTTDTLSVDNAALQGSVAQAA